MAATAHFLTSNVTRLELLRDDQHLSFATGFFLKRKGWFLITNWHVFAGRSPVDGQPLRKDGAVPNRCKFVALDIKNDKPAHMPFDLKLGDTFDGTASWLQHPKFGQEVDVAAFALGDQVPGKAKDLLDPAGHDETMWVDLGGELFLPGYPLGLAAPGAMAIWKRASLATSTEFGEGIDRCVLVDTASREGMSGSPCLAIANHQYWSLDRATGKMNLKNRPLSCRLLGVYSGRLNAKDDLGAQLGIVWRENLIFDVVDSGVPATTNVL